MKKLLLALTLIVSPLVAMESSGAGGEGVKKSVADSGHIKTLNKKLLGLFVVAMLQFVPSLLKPAPEGLISELYKWYSIPRREMLVFQRNIYDIGQPVLADDGGLIYVDELGEFPFCRNALANRKKTPSITFPSG